MSLLSYAAGPWYCLVRTETVVLLPPETNRDMVNTVWEVLSAGSGVERVLSVLSSDFSKGWSAVPPFAVVSYTDGLHVLLRGAAQLTASTGTTQVHVSGQGVSTWSERVLDSQDSWKLHLAGTASFIGEDALPLVAGIVMASAIKGGPSADSELDAEADTDDAAGEETILPGLFAAAVVEERTDSEDNDTLEPDIIAGAVPTSGLLGDHDGETVMKSDVLAIEENGDVPVDSAEQERMRPSTGPTVLARLCPERHANAPTVSLCSVCGQPVSGETRQVPRPSLGRMRLSTGEVYELESSLIVGRQPSVSRVQGSVMPRLVQVTSESGDISRSHVEVRLEGWHVMLRDLRATNGTVLIRTGQSPRRLGEGEMTMLLDGDIAQLGQDVSLRFEDLR